VNRKFFRNSNIANSAPKGISCHVA